MKLIVAGLSAFFALAPAGAHAACEGVDQPDYYSVDRERARSAYVAVVRVTGESWLGNDRRPSRPMPPFLNGGGQPTGFDPYVGALYQVQIRQSLKGPTPARLVLFSENSSGRFPMVVGRDYLIFVRDQREPWLDDRPALSVDPCGNSGLVEASGDVLRRLNAAARAE